MVRRTKVTRKKREAPHQPIATHQPDIVQQPRQRDVIHTQQRKKKTKSTNKPRTVRERLMQKTEDVPEERGLFRTVDTEPDQAGVHINEGTYDEYGSPQGESPKINTVNIDDFLDDSPRQSFKKDKYAVRIFADNDEEDNDETEWDSVRTIPVRIGNLKSNVPVANVKPGKSKKNKIIDIGFNLIGRPRIKKTVTHQPFMQEKLKVHGYEIGDYLEIPYVENVYSTTIIIKKGNNSNIHTYDDQGICSVTSISSIFSMKLVDAYKDIDWDTKEEIVIDKVENNQVTSRSTISSLREEIEGMCGFEVKIGTSIGVFKGITCDDNSQTLTEREFFIGDRVSIGIKIKGTRKGSVIRLGEEGMMIGSRSGFFFINYTVKNIKKIPRPIKIHENEINYVSFLTDSVSNGARKVFRKEFRRVLNEFYGYKGIQKKSEEDTEIKLRTVQDIPHFKDFLSWDDYLEKEYLAYRTALIRDRIDLDKEALQKYAEELSRQSSIDEIKHINELLRENRLEEVNKNQLTEELQELKNNLERLERNADHRKKWIEIHEVEKNKIYEKIKEEFLGDTATPLKGTLAKQLEDRAMKNGFYKNRVQKLDELKAADREMIQYKERIDQLQNYLDRGEMSDDYRNYLLNRKIEIQNYLEHIHVSNLLDTIYAKYDLTIERNYIDENDRIWEGLLEQLQRNNNKNKFEVDLQILLEKRKNELIPIERNKETTTDAKEIPFPTSDSQRADAIVEYIREKFGPLLSERTIVVPHDEVFVNTTDQGDELLEIGPLREYEAAEHENYRGLYEKLQNTKSRNKFEKLLLDLLRERHRSQTQNLQGVGWLTFLRGVALNNNRLASEDIIKKGYKLLKTKRKKSTEQIEDLDIFLKRQNTSLVKLLNQFAREYNEKHPSSTDELYQYLRDNEIKRIIEINLPDNREYRQAEKRIKEIKELRDKKAISTKDYKKEMREWNKIKREYETRLNELEWNQGKIEFMKHYRDRLLEIYLERGMDYLKQKGCTDEIIDPLRGIIKQEDIQAKIDLAKDITEIRCEKEVIEEEKEEEEDFEDIRLDNLVISYEQSLYNKHHFSLVKYLTQGMLLTLALESKGIGDIAQMFKEKVKSGMYTLEGTIDANISYFFPEITSLIFYSEIADELESQIRKWWEVDEKQKHIKDTHSDEWINLDAEANEYYTNINVLRDRLIQTSIDVDFLVEQLDPLFLVEEEVLVQNINEIKEKFSGSVSKDVYSVFSIVSSKILNFAKELVYEEDPTTRRVFKPAPLYNPSIENFGFIRISELCEEKIALGDLILCKDPQSSKFVCYSKDNTVKTIKEGKEVLNPQTGNPAPSSLIEKLKKLYLD